MFEYLGGFLLTSLVFGVAKTLNLYMMKNRKTNSIKFGIFLLSIVLVFQNCQNEDVNNNLPNVENIENLNLKTVSFTEAKSFFNTYNNQLIKERKSQTKASRYSIRATQQPLELSPNWDSIAHNNLYGIDQAQLTLTDVEVNRRGNYISKLFFVEQDGKIESTIFTIYQDVVEDDGRIVEATIYLNGLDGKFVDGYRIEDGRITKRLVPKKGGNIQKAAFFMFMQQKEECWNTDSLGGLDGVSLDEVTVTGTYTGGNGRGGGGSGHGFGGITGINAFYMGPSNYSSNYSGGGGGVHSRTNISSVAGTLHVIAVREKKLTEQEQEKACPDGYAKDTNGNCVKRNPCDELQNLQNNASYSAKISELKGKTGLRKETGYLQNKDGSFTKLSVTNNGHSLSIKSFSNSIGYMHTHINAYEDGVDEDGNIVMKTPIHMFSPQDVISFLSMVKRAWGSKTPMSQLYATMVSSTGTYTLKFVGNPAKIPNSFNKKNLTETYKKLMKRTNKEKGFLKFLKHHIGVEGIQLYKVKNNEKIQHKKLNYKEKVEKEDCQS